MVIQKAPHYKILFVAAEVAPFASVGGLSQVMYFLPKELKKLGHEVAIFMPKYGTIDEKKHAVKKFYSRLRVPTDEKTGVRELICNVKIKKGTKREPTVYFLENMEYFEQRANVYGYTDDHVRFALLCRGALEFLKTSSWVPDIIHANDWHTAYLINYLKQNYSTDQRLTKIATLFTIHNLTHQGNGFFSYVSPLEFDDGRSHLDPFFTGRLKKQNGLKRGIIYADMVNTVSERYSREIMTPKYGEGLDQLLKEVRAKVYGVLNGIDYDDFNPATDTFIKKPYSLKKLDDRALNKEELQREFNLPVNARIPVIAMAGRLDTQKGIDLVLKILPFLIKEHGIQFIIMGEGEARFRELLSGFETAYPEHVATHLMVNWQLPRKIFAGCDLFLLPSQFEPGGIVVIEAMRYGAVPIVRATGGLADIVSDFSIEKSTGNGFSFKEYSELALYGALSRALEIYKAPQIWKKLVKRAMEADFSWERSAKKYQDLYNRATDFRRESLSENPGKAFQ